jgi:hypothetical protein
MKTKMILLLAVLLIAFSSEAKRKDGLIYRGKQRLVPCIDIGVGYIWDHKYEKFTVSTMVNNLYSKRLGVFSVVELDMAAPAVMIGPTVTINDYAYVWGGIDIMTSRGVFGRDGFRHARKDLGIGFYPIRWATIKIAHSFNAGSRFEIGIRIPLKPEPVYKRMNGIN